MVFWRFSTRQGTARQRRAEDRREELLVEGQGMRWGNGGEGMSTLTARQFVMGGHTNLLRERGAFLDSPRVCVDFFCFQMLQLNPANVPWDFVC